jgi:hypothetical protein
MNMHDINGSIYEYGNEHNEYLYGYEQDNEQVSNLMLTSQK